MGMCVCMYVKYTNVSMRYAVSLVLCLWRCIFCQILLFRLDWVRNNGMWKTFTFSYEIEEWVCRAATRRRDDCTCSETIEISIYQHSYSYIQKKSAILFISYVFFASRTEICVKEVELGETIKIKRLQTTTFVRWK